MTTAIAHPIPALKDWRMFAGGTSAADGKHSFQLDTDKGQYNINPICWPRSNQHRGYILTFADTKGLLKSGLWYWLNVKGEGAHVPAKGAMILSEAIRAVRVHFDTIGAA